MSSGAQPRVRQLLLSYGCKLNQAIKINNEQGRNNNLYGLISVRNCFGTGEGLEGVEVEYIKLDRKLSSKGK